MDPDFWLDRWNEGRTGWQEADANALLQQHFADLNLAPGARVFVPLCGASPDIGWLLAQGCRVAGAELSAKAIARVFDMLGLQPVITGVGRLTHYAAPGLDLFQGDIFDLTAATLGPIDAIHDRAALFALPPDIRTAYAAHLIQLTGAAPQLLNCLDHDSDPNQGPPFPVNAAEVARLYGDHYRITRLASLDARLFTTGAHARDDLWLLARP